MEDEKNMKNCDNFTGQQKWKYRMTTVWLYSTVSFSYAVRRE